MKFEEFENYEKMIEKTLSKKRFKHSVNVAEQAARLAKKWGADEKRCCLAGLLHDCMKEADADVQRETALRYEGLDEAEKACRPLWHAPAAAVFMRENLGIEDAEVLRAVRFHTVAEERLSLIEKIIYLADLVSDDRDYDDVEKMRGLCYNDLDVAMSAALIYQIRSVCQKCGQIPASTFRAYNYYLKFNEEKIHL